MVADFRSRDVAAGGQGAPLVPAFHAAVFADPAKTAVVVNLGGIANLTLPARGGGRCIGFDSGPGNLLLDSGRARHLGEPHDARRRLGCRGPRRFRRCSSACCAEPYFAPPPPKSTGRDLFNADWLAAQLAGRRGRAGDVQATLLELTARSMADAVRGIAAARSRVIVCGGGANNAALMRAWPRSARRAARRIERPRIGIDPQRWRRRRSPGWRARAGGRPGNLPAVTGARGPRVLGAVYHPA